MVKITNLTDAAEKMGISEEIGRCCGQSYELGKYLQSISNEAFQK